MGGILASWADIPEGWFPALQPWPVASQGTSLPPSGSLSLWSGEERALFYVCFFLGYRVSTLEGVVAFTFSTLVFIRVFFPS